MIKKNINLMELCSSISGSPQILGAADAYDLTPSPIDDANKGSISFCSQTTEDALQIIRSSKARVIICSNKLKFAEDDYKDKTLILVPNPRLAFVRMMQKYFEQKVQFGISPSAVIDEGADIHPDVYIGPHCYIGRCQIGEGTIIYGNVHIYPNVKIGRKVIINAGTVIGADGQAYERDKGRILRKFPQIGGVIIGDNVEIGSNTSIMKGTFNNTIVGEGTKIYHLCSIGHNVSIGKHCLIVTRSVIGGSCCIGDDSQISLCACIRDGIKIGSNVTIGMGSVVTKDIGDNCVAYGVPAKVVRETPGPEGNSGD